MQPPLIVKLLIFQIAWWSTMLLASNNLAVWAAIPCLLAFALHSFWEKELSKSLSLLLVALVGYSVDQLLTRVNILEFSTTQWAPFWILAQWIAFTTILEPFLKSIHRSTFVAALTGAISGPLAYTTGDALGIVAITSWSGHLVLALAWAVVMCFAVQMTAAHVQELEPTVALSPEQEQQT